MPLDITTITALGVQAYTAQWSVFNSNPRNTLRYKVKFLTLKYDDRNKRFLATFLVERYIEQGGEWILDIAFEQPAEANNNTIVNKWGVPVPATIDDGAGNQIPNPDAWGTEYERMSILFAAQVSDSVIVESYIADLFAMGYFDFPKTRVL